ncbi:MAG: hypothetical protein CMC73_06490 [Flavobacteriaceae bacterium]|nr:hypothetical protein [Flavobacteriaceae bacterium]
MVKHFLHKMFSVFLALIVLSSTMSFTIEKHFCGDKLIDVALFSELNKCNMDSSSIDLEEFVKKMCCKDEVNIVTGQDELLMHDFDDLSMDIQTALFEVTQSINHLVSVELLSKKSFNDYSPPKLIVNRLIVNQNFLI